MPTVNPGEGKQRGTTGGNHPCPGARKAFYFFFISNFFFISLTPRALVFVFLTL